MRKLIGENKREIVLIISGVIGGVALGVLDFQESGFGLSVLAGPVLMLGLPVIPAVMDIVKNRKNPNE